jgi:aspartyl aminopeptidase
LQLNAQTQLLPTLGVELAAQSERRSFKALIAEELERAGERVTADDVVGWDLCLADTQSSTVGGVDRDLLFAPRLDNLASCHAALTALTKAGEANGATRVVVLYDHEEVGSQSASGARSVGLRALLERITLAYPSPGEQALPRALSRSLLVSADMAHAVHPNYPDKHDKQHQPRIGGGPAIKVNVSQSYATDAVGAAVFEEACREAGFSPQRFVSRNDMPCGSTIGPISAAKLGVRTVDVGNPMLSMHSCRETAGGRDVEPMIRAMTALFGTSLELAPSA